MKGGSYMPNWINKFVPINKYIRPGTQLRGIKKIVIHWTANPGGTAAGHVLYFSEVLPKLNNEVIAQGRKPIYASAHIFVDPKEAICIIPLNEVAFHANENYTYVDGKPYRGVEVLKPNANLLSIAVEMCVEKNNTLSPQTINRAVVTVKDLCEMFKLTQNDIVRHFDITRKPCPYPFVKEPELFTKFKRDVGAQLKIKQQYPGYVLKNGSQGNNVKLIQQRLGITPDGHFGQVTVNSVKNFQKNHGLTPDGIVGESTWKMMFK